MKTAALQVRFLPLSLARTLWKRKFLIVGIWILVTIATLSTVSRLPSVYRAEAVIATDSQRLPDRILPSPVSADLQDRLAPLTRAVLSPAKLEQLADEVIARDSAGMDKEELIGRLQRDILVRVDKQIGNSRPGSIRISFDGPDRAQTALVANAVAARFVAENTKSREVQASGTSAFLESQLEEAKRRLDRQEAILSRYKMAHNGELPQQETALVGQISALQSRLQADRESINHNEESLVVLENALGTARAALQSRLNWLAGVRAAAQAKTLSPGTDISVIAEDPQRPKLSDTLKERLAELRLKYSSEHPDVKRAEAGLQRVLQQETAQAAALEAAQRSTPAHPSGTAPPVAPDAELLRLRERVESLESQISLANNDIANRKEEETRIESNIAEYQARIEKLPVREQEMAQITRDHDITQLNYKQLLDKKLAADMASDMERRQQPERFTISEPAGVPDRPYKPDRTKLLFLGSLVGLVIGIVCGFGIEISQDTLLGEWELPPGVPVLGSVPVIKIGESGSHQGRFRLRAQVGRGVVGLLVIAAGTVLGSGSMYV